MAGFDVARALTGIIEMHPARALRETSMKLFGPHLDSHQRCIVLEAVAQAALAMSGKRIGDSSSPASSSASSKATRVADNEATEATTAAKHGQPTSASQLGRQTHELDVFDRTLPEARCSAD